MVRISLTRRSCVISTFRGSHAHSNELTKKQQDLIFLTLSVGERCSVFFFPVFRDYRLIESLMREAESRGSRFPPLVCTRFHSFSLVFTRFQIIHIFSRHVFSRFHDLEYPCVIYYVLQSSWVLCFEVHVRFSTCGFSEE